jgi:hypothetical protein
VQARYCLRLNLARCAPHAVDITHSLKGSRPQDRCGSDACLEVVDDAVCFWTNTEAETVVKSLTVQFHPFEALGSETMHPPDGGCRPTLMLKASLPLFAGMLARRANRIDTGNRRQRLPVWIGWELFTHLGWDFLPRGSESIISAAAHRRVDFSPIVSSSCAAIPLQ